jgi:hypothetical protein
MPASSLARELATDGDPLDSQIARLVALLPVANPADPSARRMVLWKQHCRLLSFRTRQLAESHGACRCWGSDSGCVRCRGEGKPGWRRAESRPSRLAAMTALHQEAARRAVDQLSKDPRIAGVAAGGSWLGAMDEFSDLDLVIAVQPGHEEAVRRERIAIAGSLGPLLAAFTGEHVGEPRLLICLYGPPLLHVDLKFVALADLADRVEEPSILWQRDGAMDRAMVNSRAVYPPADRQWIEDRFWVWIHYAALKIGRGELFETLDMLGFLRARVLGPLLLARAGKPPNGVRRIEQLIPDSVPALRETVARHDRADCGRALKAAIVLYRALRDPQVVTPRSSAESEAVRFLDLQLAADRPD